MTSCSALRLTGLVAIITLCWFLAPTKLPAANPAVFIDYDGDGFDDNLPDDDADGVPDEFEFHSFFSSGSFNLQTSTMFQTGLTSDATAAEETKVVDKGAFGRREFHARGICESRSDFEAGFSTGLGLGGGLGGGGACAGGVCF